MNDAEVIDFIVSKCDGSILKATQRLGLKNRQVLVHWRNRRVAPEERGRVFKAANRLGAKLPLSWLMNVPPNMESSNGREGKAARKTRHKNGKAKGGQATRRSARGVAEHRP